MTTQPITALITSEATSTSRTRAFQIAWGLALCFYFVEYAARSAPAVMIPQLSLAFGTTAVGVSAILGAYYYTYSIVGILDINLYRDDLSMVDIKPVHSGTDISFSVQGKEIILMDD